MGEFKLIAQSIRYGNERIDYNVCFVADKRDKVAIHVHPDGSVQVDAPETEDLVRIKNAVLKRVRWIITHVHQAKKQRESVLPREYISGESYLYLGRRYPLKIALVNDRKEQKVKLIQGQLRVYTVNPFQPTVKVLLWEWYKDHAKVYFSRRIKTIVNEVSWIKKEPDWQLLVMQKQWGSCSPKGKLSLNPHLVKAPKECVEYVIYHEICHLQEHNHSKGFYMLLDTLMPEWKTVKLKLDGMAEVLLNE
ncbi:MAG: M48 family metallopeptidase [Desulfamplus sp.]|nr:M48 family metallopeptidase [Desulfamplus sp.]